MTSPHSRRRFFRYSLRTLMIVVTVFCVWMGITAKRARDQRQAVEAVREVSGQVFYKHQWPLNSPSDPPGPEWLRQLMGDEYFFSVFFLNFGNPWVTDAELEHLKGFRGTNLLWLNLSNIKLPEAGLEYVKALTNLRVLNLNTTKTTDAGVAHLKGMTKLQELWLANTEITDAGLEYLRELTKLRELNLSNTQVTDEGVAKLQQALPNCKIHH